MDGDYDDDDVLALEMKPIKSNIIKKSSSIIPNDTDSKIRSYRFSNMRSQGFQLVMIIKLYMETYPRLTSTIAACITVILFLLFLLSFRQPVKRNKLYHDYSKIDMDYNFKASQIDHWCLYGGDEFCTCDDFTEPLHRFEKKDWSETHQRNVELIDQKKKYDVVFYGDEVTEGWNGRWLGRSMIPPTYATQVRHFFNESFTRAGGGDFDGVALGIMGDVVSRDVTNLTSFTYYTKRLMSLFKSRLQTYFGD